MLSILNNPNSSKIPGNAESPDSIKYIFELGHNQKMYVFSKEKHIVYGRKDFEEFEIKLYT